MEDMKFSIPSHHCPTGVLIITPEDSFYYSDMTATGWQVLLQNVNLSPLCAFAKKGSKHCPSGGF